MTPRASPAAKLSAVTEESGSEPAAPVQEAPATAPGLPEHVIVDGRRVRIEGADEIVLQCGEASMTKGEESATLAHEVGHALGDFNHVAGMPGWFYDPELMDSNVKHAARITRNRVWIDRLRRCDHGWRQVFERHPRGCGQAIRDRLLRTDRRRTSAGKLAGS